MGSLIARQDLLALRPSWAAAGRRVALTNGYFDLLHVGHVRYLAQARALTDLLVVAVNVDTTARSAKDPHRPIVPEAERAEVVAALACVDYVLLFAEATAEQLVRELRPDVYVKGGDYQPLGATPLPEAEVVRGYGGRVVVLPLQDNHSTTEIIDTILDRYRPQA